MSGREPAAVGPSLSILVVTGEYPPAIGGVGDYASHLVGSLVDRGHRVTVLTSAQPAPDKEKPTGDTGPRVIRAVGGWGRNAGGIVADIARSVQVDVVSLQYQPAAYGLSGWINILPALAKRAGLRAPMVTTFHDLRVPYLFPKAGRVRDLAVHALIGLSDTCVFTDVSDLARAHSRSRAVWIPIASNIEAKGSKRRKTQRARLGIGDDEKVVAHFGFLNATKGVDILLHAARRIIDQGIALRLLFVGEQEGSSDPTNHWSAQTLTSLAESLGIGDRIISTGFLPPEGVAGALAAADVAALPYMGGASLGRGSLLACLAQGVPVVTTRPRPAPTLPQRSRIAPFDSPDAYAITERIAALVPIGDHAALAEEIVDLLGNEGRRKSLATSGRAFARALSWENVAQAMTSVYQQALRADRRAPAGF